MTQSQLTISRILVLKGASLKEESKAIAYKHEFDQDAGSALKVYATSVFEAEEDGRSVNTFTESLTTKADSSTTGILADPALAEELKAGVNSKSKFVVEAVLQYVHVDVRDQRGRTALSHAAETGQVEIAELLLEKGALVSARQYSLSNCHRHSGKSPIHWAAMNGHREVVELLLQYGANPNARTTSGRTPIQEAAAAGHNDLVALFLSKKVDINAQAFSDVCSWSNSHEEYPKTELISIWLVMFARGCVFEKHPRGQTLG